MTLDTVNNVSDAITSLLSQFGDFSHQRKLKRFIKNRNEIRDLLIEVKLVHQLRMESAKQERHTACQNTKFLEMLSYYGLYEELETVTGSIPLHQQDVPHSLEDALSYRWLSAIAMREFMIFPLILFMIISPLILCIPSYAIARRTSYGMIP